MRYILCTLIGIWTLSEVTYLHAQDNLLDVLEEMEEERTDYTFATFKGVKIVNGHSIEMESAGVLQFIILHRFGRINEGASELFGLDRANIRLALEYGITDWLNIGLGRSNIEKTYDGFIKLRLLRQSSGRQNVPVSIVLVSSTGINTLENIDPNRELDFNNRLSYTHQLLIARKFSERFSLQLTPTLVHRNLVEANDDPNDIWALGIGARYKLNPSIAINVEYYPRVGSDIEERFHDALSLGIDIETGGHVFQLIFSNSIAMTENLFIAETSGEWMEGDIHFGFNINRVFTVSKQARIKGAAW